MTKNIKTASATFLSVAFLLVYMHQEFIGSARSTLATTPLLPLHGIQSPSKALPPIIDVRTYGAKGDGKTDDRLAIQAAINAAAAGGGGQIIFSPKATYLVGAATSPKYIRTNTSKKKFYYCIDIPSNVTLDFRGATLELKLGTDAVLLSNRHTTGQMDQRISIRDGVFNGNSVNLQNKALIWFVGVTDLTFNATIVNTIHIAAQFADITHFVADRMIAHNIRGIAFYFGSVAPNGAIRSAYINNISVTNVSAESQPYFPGNPLVAFMINSHIAHIEVKHAEAGIKVLWDTDQLLIDDIILENIGSNINNNSGFKVQGDGINNPKNVTVGTIIATGQYGPGLYIQNAHSTHIRSYFGLRNALRGNSPDVWIAGSHTTVDSVKSDSSGNVGLEVRPDATDYKIGTISIRNPGLVNKGAAVSVDGGSGTINAIEAQADHATSLMTNALAVNRATATTCVGRIHSTGQIGPAVNLISGAKVSNCF
jgi:hypothetical protein